MSVLSDTKLQVDEVRNNADTALPNNLLPITASAWVNFDGTGTVAIRDSFNISSITDNGTGDYNPNFTSAKADSNYAAVASSHEAQCQCLTFTTTTFRLVTRNNVGAATDSATVTVVVHGGQ